VKSRTLTVDRPLDLGLTLGVLRDGAGDPCLRLHRGRALRATRTPEGPATLQLGLRDGELEAQAWGPGSEWALEHVGDLVGMHDDEDVPHPAHVVVRDLLRRFEGMRIGRTLCVFEALVPVIIGQKVAGREAVESYRALVRRYGEAAPGPPDLRLPPDPATLATLGYYDFHPLGIERRRAEALRSAAVEAPRLESLEAGEPKAARRRLEALRGVGRWTSAHVARIALGDPDAVILDDWNLPHIVAYALAREERATDERMLELLAPYAGQRGRVQRLIVTGFGAAPRRGPRRRLRNLAAM
jgi:3-methyladenine DNA glycosylase/8-oxoguanine DNA glycosylase